MHYLPFHYKLLILFKVMPHSEMTLYVMNVILKIRTISGLDKKSNLIFYQETFFYKNVILKLN